MSAKAEKIIWTDVDSSNVKSVAYFGPSKVMGVEFHNGSFYSYEDVAMDVYTDLVHAESVGVYLARVIKTSHLYEKHLSKESLENYMLQHHHR